MPAYKRRWVVAVAPPRHCPNRADCGQDERCKQAMQIIGRRHAEQLLLNLARVAEVERL
jgi:hypothetical protein